MRVAWKPVLADPSIPADPTNAIVGRYAFWIDDESSKLNYNTAPGKDPDIRTHQSKGGDLQGVDTRMLTPRSRPRDATDNLTRTVNGLDSSGNPVWYNREFTLGGPNSINLDIALEDLKTGAPHPVPGTPGVNDFAIRESATRIWEHYYNQGAALFPEAVVSFLPGDGFANHSGELPQAVKEEWFNRNRFNLTFFSRSPEINAFGRLRYLPCNITDPLETSGIFQPPFLYQSGGNIIPHVYAVPTTGGASESFYASRALTVHEIYDYLKRADWPLYEGRSFADKYGRREAFQIALNIWSFAYSAVEAKAHGNGRHFQSMATAQDIPTNAGSLQHDDFRPEIFCWKNEEVTDSNTVSGFAEHVPQFGGPYISEVRLVVEPEQVGNTAEYYLKAKWIAELYVQPYGNSNPNKIRVRTDVLRLDVSGGNVTVNGESNWILNGAPVGEDHRGGWDQKNVDKASKQLAKSAAKATRLVSGNPGGNFVTVESPPIYLCKEHNDWGEGNGNAGKRATLTGSGSFDVKARLRIGLESQWGRPRQIVPHPWEWENGIDTDDDEYSVFEFDLDVELPPNPGDPVDPAEYSFEVRDPLRGHFLSEWKGTEDGSLEAPNDIAWSEWADPEYEAAHFADMRWLTNHEFKLQPPVSWLSNRVHQYGGSVNGSRRKFPSEGYLTIIRTDLAREDPTAPTDTGLGKLASPSGTGWQTLAFNDETSYADHGTDPDDPKDILLMDLLRATYAAQVAQWASADIGPDTFSSVSYAHSCFGRVNLNNVIYPQVTGLFEAPRRTRPLRGVFRHMRPDADLVDLVEKIEDFQTDPTAGRPFFYVGELGTELDPDIVSGSHPAFSADPPGSAPEDTQHEWEREELIRNFAGSLCTNSNTFGVWGAAQVVKKSQTNLTGGDPASFETGDRVLAEKRFYAVVERYLWTGRDGRVGNAHTDATTGHWDRKAYPVSANVNAFTGFPGGAPIIGSNDNSASHWAMFDGKHPVGTVNAIPVPGGANPTVDPTIALGTPEYTPSSLEAADNPAAHVTKYRVVYFKYLDQ